LLHESSTFDENADILSAGSSQHFKIFMHLFVILLCEISGGTDAINENIVFCDLQTIFNLL